MPKVGQTTIGVLETVTTGIRTLKGTHMFVALIQGPGHTGIQLLNPMEIGGDTIAITTPGLMIVEQDSIRITVLVRLVLGKDTLVHVIRVNTCQRKKNL